MTRAADVDYVVQATSDPAAADFTVNALGGGSGTVEEGAGNPTSTPSAVGDHYIDTTGGVVWVAVGTTDSTDWVQVSGLGGGDLISTNNLSDVANAATARQNLDLEIGVDVQAYAAALDAVSGTNTGDEVQADQTTAGIAEVATAAEIDTGTDDTRMITPLGLTSSTNYTTLTDGSVADSLHVHNVAGASELRIPIRNKSGGTLNPGQPVYITGYSVGQNLITVDEADASLASTMPALGLIEISVGNNSSGNCIAHGEVSGFDTTGPGAESWSVGDAIYVSETAGALTNVKPTGAALVQKMGIVTRVSASAGRLQVVGAGRSNDLPNLPQNEIWKGNGSGVPTGTDHATALLAALAANTANVDFNDVALLQVGPVEERVNTVATTGATETLDIAEYGVHDCTMDQNCVFTFSNPAASGEASSFTLILRGAFTPTFPASVDWPDGSAPTYTTPTLFVFTTVDAGTTWLGTSPGKALA